MPRVSTEEDGITPLSDTIWSHRNGNRYKVLFITNLPDEPRYPKTVVYQGVTNGMLWSRPVSDWHRSMTMVEDNAGA